MRTIDQLRSWLDGLAPRERSLVVWGGIAAAVLVFLGALVMPLYTAAAKSAARVEQKRADLSWMRGVVAELRAAGPAGPSASSGQSLVVIIDQTARQAGLERSLSGSQPSGTGGIRVRLEAAPFDTVVAWIALLQQQHAILVESATMDHGAAPGVVNASIVLNKAG